MPLTTVELGKIEECLKQETLLGKKLEVWRNEIRDPELRRLADECVRSSQQNTDTMLHELRG